MLQILSLTCLLAVGVLASPAPSMDRLVQNYLAAAQSYNPEGARVQIHQDSDLCQRLPELLQLDDCSENSIHLIGQFLDNVASYHIIPNDFLDLEHCVTVALLLEQFGCVPQGKNLPL